jgi:5-formyltetrahydrofolate cyclo-ligase
MLNKAEIRKTFRLLRDSFAEDADRKRECDSRIAQNLLPIILGNNRAIQSKTFWFGYRARGSEADPAFAISQNLKNTSEIRWAFPKVQGKEICFLAPNSLEASSDSWKLSDWGILEPNPEKSEAVSGEEARGILVPGLAFDRDGTRLGSGKGFYDIALNKFKGVKVGLAYSVQISERALPREVHDIPMDFVITEDEVIAIRSEERVSS